MQGSARKDVVFGAARVYTVAVPGPKCKSWFNIVSLAMIGSLALCAQTNTGSIRVLVYDETMAVIQDVTVTALDESRSWCAISDNRRVPPAGMLQSNQPPY